jgi:YgiT-type zinc finger domain-containing protein
LKRFNDPLSMIPCSDCNIGQMRKTSVTYFHFMGGRMITVPDFPAWVCDMCGKCEYDMQALDNLSLLLNPQDSEQPARHQARSAGKGKAFSTAVRPITRK